MIHIMHARRIFLHAPRSASPAALAAALVIALVVCAGCGSSGPGRGLSTGAVATRAQSHVSHLVMIVMENAGYGEVIGNRSAPFVNALARRYGVAKRSYAITHPSLPNYLALTGGSTHGLSSDCTDCSVGGASIVDQLETAGASWRAYLEGMPRPCYRGAEAGGYAKKHNPFIYYRDLAATPASCRRLVGFAQLQADLRSNALPDFAWITPNLCDSGHDCGVAGGDRFLARTVPSLLREIGPHGLLLITWDEGVGNDGCCGRAHGGRVATVLAGPEVRPGTQDSSPVDSYGVLATVEQVLGLAPLHEAANTRSGTLLALLRPGWARVR